jgi:hypothetical protein
MYKSSTSSSKRIATLKRKIAGFDRMCSGNLRRRHTICGTLNCRCKAQSPEPHGPYYYWSRLLAGKVVQRVLSQDQAEIVARGIENYRQLKTLLRKWEEETVRSIESRHTAK